MSTQTMIKPDTLPKVFTNMAIAIYSTHTEAENAIKELQKSGFDMRKLSLIGKDYHTEEQVVGYYNTGERMKAWGKLGAFWGGIWGLLFWGAFFVIPGVGPVFLAGPLVAAIVGTLEGMVVVGGLSVIGAALVGMGIPENSVVNYEAKIAAGKFMLIVHGAPEEITMTKAILELTNHEGLQEHAILSEPLQISASDSAV